MRMMNIFFFPVFKTRPQLMAEDMTLLYHRVKKKDLKRLANYNRMQIRLKPIQSSTTAYNRSRPENIRSIQAKQHHGLGLFCCKSHQKAETTPVY